MVRRPDGGGRSLELINASLPNEFGRNWAASVVDGGTPGQVNSVAATDIAPMILDVRPLAGDPRVGRCGHRHRPDPRRANDRSGCDPSLPTGHLHLRQHEHLPQFNVASYLSVPMVDDGMHGDGQANDGVFGGRIPAQANGKIVEFYVEARDSTGRTRTWPAPSMIDGVP